jgi:NADH-quinone oxidoreductase subunit A
MKLFLYNFEIIFNSYTIFEYFNLFYFVCISIGLTIILLLLSFLFSPALGDKEKLSPYECGFEPFGDSRNLFDVQFYVVALLFIIFDLEIAFLLP